MRSTLSRILVLFVGVLVASPVLSQTLLSPREIAFAAEPAVVHVRALVDGQVAGSGSGFFIREDGVFVTNLHVVEGAHSLQVEITGGEVFDNAFFVAVDERRDIVVLRIPVSGVQWLTVGDDGNLAVGDPVYAMGHPRGFSHTFSDGIVSAKRTVEGVSYIQITAPISPGSSGGPVLDSYGRVIGVATLSHSGAQNLNMAVPARHATDLLALAQAPRPFHEVAAHFGGVPAPATTREEPGIAGVSRGGLPSNFEDLHPAAQRMVRDMQGRFEAANEWERTIMVELVLIVQTGTEFGYYPNGPFYIDSVQEREWVPFNITLPRGQYVVAGTCDEDCSDMDLEVTSRGSVVARDVDVTDSPAVGFEVPASGAHTIRARVYDCGTTICYFGLQVLRLPD